MSSRTQEKGGKSRQTAIRIVPFSIVSLSGRDVALPAGSIAPTTSRLSSREEVPQVSEMHSPAIICARDDDRVAIWDPVTLAKIGELPSGLDPKQFALSPDTHHLYIANEDDDIVTVVETKTCRAIAQVDVGIKPEGVAMSPGGKIAINTSRPVGSCDQTVSEGA